MCMSVPQMAERCTLMSTSLCPTEGSATSCIQIPRSARALTSAFMSCPLVNDSEFAPGLPKGLNHTVELFLGVRGVHLGANARLAMRHYREGKRHHIDPK